MAKNLSVGLAYEGERDKEPLLILVEKILGPLGFSYVITRSVTPRTGIIGSVKLYLKVFFSVERVDIAILVTDQDVAKGVDDRKKHIRSIIQEVNSTYLNFCAIGVCIPHFEAWLVADQNNLKNIFSFPSEDPLPDCSSPKRLIEELHKAMPIPKPTLHEVYNHLAEGVDIEILRKISSDFNLFADELIAAAKQANEVE